VACGFWDQTHLSLSKHFQRFFGTTPGLFRSRQGHFSRIRIALEPVKKLQSAALLLDFRLAKV
jgi:AraC-like DNA-binding protein